MCRIIIHFFLSYDAEMYGNLWRKAPTKEDALGQMSTNFQVYFINIIFLRSQTKKFTIEPKSYSAMLLYLFFDSLLSTCQKKKWKLKNGPRLPTFPLCISFLNHYLYFQFIKKIMRYFIHLFFLNNFPYSHFFLENISQKFDTQSFCNY